MRLIFATLTVLSALLFCYGIGCFDAEGVEDVTAPALTGWSFPGTTLDTSSGPQTVNIALNITDGLTGFNRGTVCLRPPDSGSQMQFVRFDAAQRVSGSANNGTYSVPVTLPQYARVGAWKIANVELIDAVGNSRVLRLGDTAFGNYSTVWNQ